MKYILKVVSVAVLAVSPIAAQAGGLDAALEEKEIASVEPAAGGVSGSLSAPVIVGVAAAALIAAAVLSDDDDDSSSGTE